MSIRGHALALVDDERDRQEELRQEGALAFTAASPDCPDLLRLSALIEEIGEVGRCFNEADTDHLVGELTQVAAIAVAWIEAIDAN